MDRAGKNCLSCVVCGIETKRHAGWFMVLDNCWLDRVKILTWHSVLSQQERMRSVCGKSHLRTLLTHWFLHADLQLGNGTPGRIHPVSTEPAFPLNHSTGFAPGTMLGELALERDPQSTVWTGSPETMEYILNALIGETEPTSQALAVSLLEQTLGYSQYYAYR